LYVHDQQRGEVGVVMPDARYRGRRQRHLDNTDAEPHVGYVRFDLANLASSAADGVPIRDPAETPGYEVVHQFDRAALDFGLPWTLGPITVDDLHLPIFDDFAPILTTKPGLFGDSPPPEALMRAVLQDGTLTSVGESDVRWELSGELRPDGRPTVYDELGSGVRWTRTVNARAMTLRVASFDGGRVTEIPLRPTQAPGDGAAIALKFGNLCKNNPLEWRTYEPVDAVIPDTDFKWLYGLMRLKDTGDRDRFPPRPPRELPHPRPIRSGNMNAVYDCIGALIRVPF
jgi:hypothetical protein